MEFISSITLHISTKKGGQSLVDQEKQSLELFGQFLMQNMRDYSATYYESLLQGKDHQAFQDLLTTLTPEQVEVMKQGFLLAVDAGIHHFLHQLETFLDVDPQDQDGIHIVVNGHDVVAISDGMGGELYGQYGWIRKYSAFPESDI